MRSNYAGSGSTMKLDVRDHAGLIHTVAQRYAAAARNNGGLSFDDLVQAGWIGAMRGAETYDPALGAPSTYLWQWIRQAIQREVADRAETVRVPTNEQIRRRAVGGPARAVVHSLDARCGDDGSTHVDLLASPENDCELPSLDDLIACAPELTEREIRVLRLKAADKDMAMIGRELGFSRERARQIFLAAVEKIRESNGIEVDAGDAHAQSLARMSATKARSIAAAAQRRAKGRAA